MTKTRTPLIAMCALVLVLTGAAALQAGLASRIARASAASTSAPTLTENVTKVIPWGVANHIPDCDCRACQAAGGYYNRILECLRLWRISVDEAIVTTHPRPSISDPVMRGLVKELAPLRIIPGVDPNPALVRRLDNVEGWRQVAAAVPRLMEITGSERFVINAELSIKSMRLGEYVPDWDKVRVGLKLLPRDVEYIWYPSISCWVDRPGHKKWTKDDLTLQTTFLSLVVETLPNVTLTTFEHMAPGSATSEAEAARQAYVLEHFKVPTIPRVWFYDDSYYWDVVQFPEAFATCQSPTMTAYLGAGESFALSRLAPLVLRHDLQRRLAVVQERAEIADKQADAMRRRAEAAEGTLDRVRDDVCEAVAP